MEAVNELGQSSLNFHVMFLHGSVSKDGNCMHSIQKNSFSESSPSSPVCQFCPCERIFDESLPCVVYVDLQMRIHSKGPFLYTLRELYCIRISRLINKLLRGL